MSYQFSEHNHSTLGRTTPGPPSADDLFSALPFPACILNEQGIILQVNRFLIDWLGYPAGALQEKSVSEILTPLPAGFPAQPKSFFSSITSAQGERLSAYLSVSSFTSLSEHLHLLILQPANDSTNAAVSTNPQQLAEDKLLMSESKYRLLFEVSPLPMYVMDRKNYGFLAVNKAMQILYEYSADEFLRMTSINLRPQSEVERFVTYLKNINKPGSQGVWKHKTKTNKQIYVEVITHNINYEGKDAVLVILNDVTEKLKVERKIRRINKDLRELSAHLQNIREEERTQIARDIHDELGQQLTALKMDLSWMGKHAAKNAEVVKKISEMIQLVNETMSSMRRITSDLRPSLLDHLGLVPALEWLNEDMEKRYGVSVQFSADEMPEMPIEISTNLFRIYQEALTNVIRHAEAGQIKSSLKAGESSVQLEICDDGKGIASNQRMNGKGFGLLGIKERVFATSGLYMLSSEPGKGTCLKVEIPLKMEGLV